MQNLARVRNTVAFDVAVIGTEKVRCARVFLAEEDLG